LGKEAVGERSNMEKKQYGKKINTRDGLRVFVAQIAIPL
jgi:hypothetical protein